MTSGLPRQEDKFRARRASHLRHQETYALQQLAAHSITSSARASSKGGTVRAGAFATVAFLHKRDAGPAMRSSVAIENGQVHEPVAKDVSNDRREGLSAVDMDKEPIAGKP